MATLTFNNKSYTVDHAVKGPDFVHGYDANGACVVALEGVTNFSGIIYSGTYLTPENCVPEACNNVKFCGGKLKTADGRDVPGWTVIWENAEPTAVFPEQTISIEGLAEYNMFMVTAVPEPGINKKFSSFCYIPDGAVITFDVVRFDGSNGAWGSWERDVTIDLEAGTIHFSLGMYNKSGSSANYTNVAVPIYILATKV